DTICYNVELIGQTQHGCIDSTAISICVFPDPIAELNLDSIASTCAPVNIDTLGILAISHIQAQPDDSIFWEIIDSSGVVQQTGTGLNCPTYLMNNQNDYVWIVITATNSCGSDIDSLQFWTSEDPVADFTLDTIQGCDSLTVQTNITSNSSTGSYTWVVFDVTGGTNTVYETVFTTTQNFPNFTLGNTSNTDDRFYIIQLTVGDPDNGCDSTLTSDTITVWHNPLALFTISDTALCAPNTINVNDSSITGNNIAYQWSVSPGSPDAIVNTPQGDNTDIDFVDNTSGTSNFYDITLNITDDRGCTSDTTHTVELWTRPISIFNIDSLQCGPVNSLSPNNNSLYATGNTDFIWDIISPATGWTINNINDSVPVFSFDENTGPNPIDYIIELTTTTINGCTDIATDTVTIFPTPIVNFTVTDSVDCGPFTVIFNNISDAQNSEDTASMNFWWIVENDTLGYNSTFQHTFDTIIGDTICYNVELIGQTQHGCI
ncbi:MAG: hypothetical protein ACKVJK_16275, partial [Methylophagaceae bacterium]